MKGALFKKKKGIKKDKIMAYQSNQTFTWVVKYETTKMIGQEGCVNIIKGQNTVAASNVNEAIDLFLKDLPNVTVNDITEVKLKLNY